MTAEISKINMNKNIIKDFLNYSRKTKAASSQAVYEELLTRIGQVELSKKTVGDISNDEIISILRKMKSERESAIELYNKANRQELSKTLNDEILVINNHLPINMNSHLSKEETEILVDDYIASFGISSKKMMGTIIKHFKEAHGNKLDMKVLSTVLNSKLT